MSEEGAQAEGREGLILLDAAMLCLWLILGLVVSFGLIFMVPKFAEIFAQLDVPLPAPTLCFLWLSKVFSCWWYLVLPLGLLLSAVPIALKPGRSWPVYLIAAMLAMIMTVGGVLFVYMPIVKIQQMLSKRK
jgi:hypothetical protein